MLNNSCKQQQLKGLMLKQTVFFSSHNDCNPTYTGKFLISTIRIAKASNKQCDLLNKESQEFKFSHNIRML